MHLTKAMQWHSIVGARPGKAMKIQSIAPFDIYRIYVKDDGTYPNNEEYPTLIYKRAFDGTEADGRRMILNDGGWTNPWLWG